jgi:uncharacterized protein YbcI
MNSETRIMAQQIAKAVTMFMKQSTGHAPTDVTVVLSDDTLLITLHAALTPAEKALAQNPAGAAEIQEFHRQLFSNSNASLRQDVQRISGREVREAAAEVDPQTGTVVHALTAGILVEVYLFTKHVLLIGKRE